MPSLAEYNEILPKESSSVGIQWKVLQILVYVLTAVCGYACAIIFGYWLQDLQGQCPLYADIKFLPYDNNTDNFALEIDFTASKWGKDALCSFCQFVPILTAVYAFICGGSFACCGRGGRSRDGVEPWKLVFAALAFSLVFMPIAMTAAAVTTAGLSESCKTLAENLEEMGQTKLARGVCTGRHDSSIKLPETSSLELLEVIAWMSASGWGLAALILLTRYLCLADFDVVTRKRSSCDAKPLAIGRASTSLSDDKPTVDNLQG